MRQVLVRKPQASGDNLMVRANVLSERDGVLRVVFEDQRQRQVSEVQASEVMDARTVFGTADRRVQGILPRSYPTSPNALGNRYRS